MKFNIEKAFQACGNNNRYQKFVFLSIVLTWFAVDFVAIAFPLLELMPNFKCKNAAGIMEKVSNKAYCEVINKNDCEIDTKYINIISDYNLYCSETLVILIGVAYATGVTLGAVVVSKLSDVLGRKPVLLLGQASFFVCTLLLTIKTNVYIILTLLFSIGLVCVAGTMVSFLYIYEILAPNRRAIYGTLINSSFAAAGLIYFTLFKYMYNWVYVAYLCAASDLIAFFVVLFYYIESPRFLISKGKVEQAIKCLQTIANRNGKREDFKKFLESDLNIETKDTSSSNNQKVAPTFDQSIINSDLQSLKNKKIENKEEPLLHNKEKESDDYSIDVNDSDDPKQNKEAGFLALFKYKSLRYKFLICCYLWFAMSFTYYGISLALKNSADDVFIDGYVVYGAESIAYVITGILISIAFFGRVRSLTLMMLISSISTCQFFIFKYFQLEPYEKIWLFLARFGITSIYSIMYTYSTEVYPTVIRAKGLGLNTLSARLSTIIVPIIVEKINPFPIFSCLCFLGFLLTFLLPETFGRELEDEIHEEKLLNKPIKSQS